MKMLMTPLFLLNLFAGTIFVAGDTPAECLYEDIKGTWTFSESARTYDNSVACEEVGTVQYVKNFTLDYYNQVTDEMGNKGTWTLIYNQGFEVNINQRSYFAFSYFEKNRFGGVTSYCHQTFPGWSRDVTVRNWSCFKGQKLQPTKQKESKKSKIIDFFRKFVNDHHLIRRINQVQKSWRAGSYPQFQKYTIKDMIKRAGGILSTIKRRISTKPANQEQKDRVKNLPKNFDWRNVDNYNYLTVPRDQGNCGSCYAFAALAAIEARLQIANPTTKKTVFSTQDVVDCSRLSQGCDGGFNYLIAGRYAMEQGVISEEYNEYKGFDDVCNRDPNAQKTYVSNYTYIGGYFGACNEELMLDVLHREGPFPVAFQVNPDFFQYTGGIYRHTGLRSRYNPLVVTNHAVVVVGYGVDEETGEKFWTIRNSWGKYWGEEGYFRILRGTNECGIESMAMNMQVIP